MDAADGGVGLAEGHLNPLDGELGAEVDAGGGALPFGARRLSRRQLLAALATAGFQQTF